MASPQHKPGPGNLQLVLAKARSEKADKSAAAETYSAADWRPGADVPRMYEPSVADPRSTIGIALTDLKNTVQKWLHCPDTALVELAAGFYVANRIPGPPIWVHIIGPPSDGKTEQVQPITYCDLVWPVSQLTVASMLSGTSEHDKIRTATGGTMMQVGALGMIFCKDFTSVLAMNRDRLNETLAALREIYDGRWDRPIGSDGGKTLVWQGKCGIVTCVTPAIDSHQHVIDEMGPRFLTYRCLETDGHAQGSSAIDRSGKELAEMQEAFGIAMRRLITAVDLDAALVALDAEPPELSPETKAWMLPLAEVVVRARSTVTRDGYTHEVTNPGVAEAPARLVKQLKQFHIGLAMAGVSAGRIRQLLTKMAFDGIPPTRHLIIDKLRQLGSATALELTAALESYSRSAIERHLEDMAIHKLVCRPGGRWQIMTYYQERYEEIFNEQA